jgi:hypothetical protein
MSSEDRENYPMGNNDAEIQRLRAQHEWLKAGMDGQLIFAPIDRSQENLRILDSGTADGMSIGSPPGKIPCDLKLIKIPRLLAQGYIFRASQQHNLRWHRYCP